MKLTWNRVLLLGLCNTAQIGVTIGYTIARLCNNLCNPVGGTILLILGLLILFFQIKVIYKYNKKGD